MSKKKMIETEHPDTQKKAEGIPVSPFPFKRPEPEKPQQTPNKEDSKK